MKGYKEVRGKVGFFGTVWRVLFLGWQALMVYWFVWSGYKSGLALQSAPSEAYKTGVLLGTGISWVLILFFWVGGSIVLGIPVLLTRPAKMLVASEEPPQARMPLAASRPLPRVADEKTCPRCAETVKAGAKVCRYCGYEFESTSPARSTQPSAVADDTVLMRAWPNEKLEPADGVQYTADAKGYIKARPEHVAMLLRIGCARAKAPLQS